MTRQAAGWALGCILLAVPCFHSGFVQSRTVEDSPGQVTGAALAPLILGGLIALLCRWIYVRHMLGHGAIWSPWLTVIALMPAVLVAVQDPGAEREDSSFQPDASCSGPAPTARDLTSALGGGLRTTASPRDFVDAFPQQYGPLRFQRVTSRDVVRGRRPVGFVVVLEADVEVEEEDIVDGFSERAGTAAVDVPLGGEQGHLVETPQFVGIVGSVGPCDAVLVGAGTAADARQVAAALRL